MYWFPLLVDDSYKIRLRLAKKILKALWRPSWSCDLDHLYNFRPPLLRMSHMMFGFDLAVSKEIFEIVNDVGRTTDDGRWSMDRL